MTPKERAAKAIAGLRTIEPEKTWNAMGATWRSEFVRDAEAALAAIAEPSDAMIDAMKNSCWNSLTDDDARKVWRAAHAAMMAEKDIGK